MILSMHSMDLVRIGEINFNEKKHVYINEQNFDKKSTHKTLKTDFDNFSL